MPTEESRTGRDLKAMFAAATLWLERSASDIDALNVFPVPDGDTGTNMLLTMRSTMDEVADWTEEDASAVAQAMARGALMGARGNSGVILSQILRGLARGLNGKRCFGGGELAQSLEEAVTLAYQGVSRPVEGTMLTVIRESAQAARQAFESGRDLLGIMEAVVASARDSVARTPALLSVLREAGVVDAGGQGLYVILEGALRCLRGEEAEMAYQKPRLVASAIPLVPAGPVMAHEEEVSFGYCTEFILEGERLSPERLRKRLERKGESVMVVGDERTLRVHIHSPDPGPILSYAVRQGTLHQVSIRNMDEQHRDYLEMRRSLAPEVNVATVAVASGEGLMRVFKSLGASAVVPGGQTMNPSTRELLAAIEQVASDKVIVLPNNSNIVATARQAQSVTTKKVEVVPTETIPQGVAALLAFNYEADLEANALAMDRARAGVKTVEFTRAVRATRIGHFKIGKDQVLGFLDGELVAVAEEPKDVLEAVVARSGAGEAEVVTVYHGKGVSPAEAEEFAQAWRQLCPGVEVEVINGGQPHYDYIISVE
ncbi:MAG TPA: DAK2 domain-containing protein [Dehalococcoidia bacterium]|nr:DAK2 domain-containing protein [Dehalococcoidia bacterium]